MIFSTVFVCLSVCLSLSVNLSVCQVVIWFSCCLVTLSNYFPLLFFLLPLLGAMFKERVKEKQRLQTHDKFSLVESLRLSGSDVSLNSMDSTPERQRTSPFGARKDTNHKQTIPKGPMADTDDSMVSQPAHPISKEEPDSVKNYMTREKTPVLCSEDTDEAMNDGENRAHEAQVEVANHGVVGGTGDLSVLRDKGKKKKLTFWQRFSAAVTKKGHVVGSVEDLREVPMSGSFNTFQGRRVGSVDCLLDDSRPSMLDRSVGISTCTVSSDESNDRYDLSWSNLCLPMVDSKNEK